MNQTANPALTVTTPSDCEIVMTRVFDAPRSLVFAAFTDPAHLPHWFGPHGWTLPVCQVDLRPGGAWRYILRGPDGEEMGMRGVYQEVTPPARLVSTESYDDYPGEALNTVTFDEENGRTTLTLQVLYPSKETRDAVLQSGMEKGASESFDRLSEHLRTMA